MGNRIRSRRSDDYNVRLLTKCDVPYLRHIVIESDVDRISAYCLQRGATNELKRSFCCNDVDVMTVFNEFAYDRNCLIRSNAAGYPDDNA